MGYNEVFEHMIDEKLLSMDTAYIAKVLSYGGGTATLQPLTMIKQYGQSAQKPSVVSNAPVIQSARYKYVEESVEVVTDIGGTKETITYLKPVELSQGDLVVCICADRDITEAKNGIMATPQIGHHSRSDSVVVGIL